MKSNNEKHLIKNEKDRFQKKTGLYYLLIDVYFTFTFQEYYGYTCTIASLKHFSTFYTIVQL